MTRGTPAKFLGARRGDFDFGRLSRGATSADLRWTPKRAIHGRPPMRQVVCRDCALAAPRCEWNVFATNLRRGTSVSTSHTSPRHFRPLGSGTVWEPVKKESLG